MLDLIVLLAQLLFVGVLVIVALALLVFIVAIVVSLYQTLKNTR